MHLALGRRNKEPELSLYGNVPDKDRKCEALAAFLIRVRESVFKIHYRAIWEEGRPRSLLRVGATHRSKR